VCVRVVSQWSLTGQSVVTRWSVPDKQPVGSEQRRLASVRVRLSRSPSECVSACVCVSPCRAGPRQVARKRATTSRHRLTAVSVCSSSVCPCVCVSPAHRSIESLPCCAPRRRLASSRRLELSPLATVGRPARPTEIQQCSRRYTVGHKNTNIFSINQSKKKCTAPPT